MREAKRVLLAPKLWGLLAMLLALNCMLLASQDTHMEGFYTAYQVALPEFSALPPEEAEIQAEQELVQLQELGLLHMFRDEENPEIKALIREDCADAFGADFEARLEAGEFDLSDAAIQENYKRREVLQTLLEQLAHLREYPAYLEQVQANVRQMSALSLFNQEGSFSSRNIEKTGRDFPASVELQLGNDFAVTMLVTDELGGYSLLIFTLFLALQFLEERKRGLWSLVHGAPEGRARLAGKRSLLLLAGVALGTLVLLGCKLAFGAVIYGGLGDLTRNVQSLSAFADFPWVLPVWEALFGYFLLKILGMWLVGLAIWAILQAVNHLPLAIGAAGAVLVAEYTLFRAIPDSYGIVVLRYVNLFALVDVPKIALHYLNLNFFGWPVQGFLLSLGLIPPLLGLLLAANLFLTVRKKPVSRQNSLLVLFDRLRIPFSKAVGRLRLLGYELYKLLWLQKGILVLLAVAWFSFFALEAPYPDTQLYDTELAGLSASMEGPITEDTLAGIDERNAEYSAWEPSEAVLRQLEILDRLREKASASLAANDGLWLINQAPFAALMGKNVGNYQRQNAVVLLLSLSLLLSGIFAQEKQNRMTQLLHGTPRGRRNLLRKKLLAALGLTVLVWLLFEAGELHQLIESYGSPALAAPLQSFDAFASLPYSASLGTGVLLYLLLRLLGMLAAAGVVLICSRLCKNTNTAILLSCAVLVLPACLSYMGIELFSSLSPVRLFSPLELLAVTS
ncbi:MAG: hypothetical protein IJG45_00745 [Oscillospiraceae bacterium]|nr:hypothetical protein [Oscillospiraceae bacterium]